MRRTAMARCLSFAIGFLAFAAAHAIEVVAWSTWFGGAHDPWFLNSGRAIALTLVVQFAASLLAGWFRLPGFPLALGGFAGMALVLFLKGGGAGTIFPIALAAGGLFIAGSALLGAWLGLEVNRWRPSNRSADGRW